MIPWARHLLNRKLCLNQVGVQGSMYVCVLGKGIVGGEKGRGGREGEGWEWSLFTVESEVI